MDATITRVNAGTGGVCKRFYTEREVAILGVSQKCLQGWRLRGREPTWKKLGDDRCGRTAPVRYPVDECERWLARCGGGGQTA